MNPQSLNMQQHSQTTTNHPSMYARQQQMMSNMTPSNMTPEQFNNFRENDISRQRDMFEKRLVEQKKMLQNMDTAPQADEISTIEVNPEIGDILHEVEDMSNRSKSGTTKKRRKTRTSKTVKVDV
jgi:hypothetical protein